MDVAAGRLRRLIVTMPPRHGKSELVSKYFPAWYLGRYAKRGGRVILSSYEADFAASWGAQARDVLVELGASIFGLRMGDTASNRWSVQPMAGLRRYRAGMQTAGVGGPITGKGATLFIIDDPIKNDEEALSAVYREKTWNWFRSVAYTRLEPGASMVIVMTRWHEDDLVGRLLRLAKAGGETWTVINFPAICDDQDDPLERELGRSKGEALWSERYDAHELAAKKATVGSYWFSALYQQRPAPIEGGIFKRHWFRTFDLERIEVEADGQQRIEWVCVLHRPDGPRRVLMQDCWRFSTVDLAQTLDEKADYTVVATFAVTEDMELLLLDVVRERFEGPDHQGLIRMTFQRHAPAFIGVEDAGYQVTLIQELLREGLPIKRLKADKKKTLRAIPIAVRYENGMVYHRADAGWRETLEAELLNFPNDVHDDMVDTLAYAGIELAVYGQPRMRGLG